MNEKKSKKNQLITDLLMLPISIYMAFDYFFLIQNGDDSLRRKIVLAIWVIAVIAWSIKLVYDLKTKTR